MNDSYKHPLWQRKRLEILSRDKWACVACGDADSTLHVHHAIYDGEPWEVRDEWLQTLCESCHEDLGIHPKAGVYWYRPNGSENPVVAVCWCPQCGGTKFKDRNTYIECVHCRWQSSIYSRLGTAFSQSIEFVQEEKKKPKEYSLGWLRGMITKVKKGGASDLEIFNAIFPSHPAHESVARLCDAAREFAKRQQENTFSCEEEISAIASLVRCRRDIVRQLSEPSDSSGGV